MSKKVENGFLVPALFLALLISFTSSSASAEEMVMVTITTDMAGTDEILDGKYLEAIPKSLYYVDTSSNIRRVAARTNLCVAYTATRQYDEAVKWCDAAVEVGRRAKVTKNNRAILAYMMGDYDTSAKLLSEAGEALGGNIFLNLDHNSRVLEHKVAELEEKAKTESFAQTE